jgi:hypothetical protein
MPEAEVDAGVRAALIALREAIVPGDAAAPSAGEADPDGSYLDEALRLRADLLPALEPLGRLSPADPGEAMAALQRQSPELAALVSFLVVGAYYLSPAAREAAGFRPTYEQVAPESVEELVAPVLARAASGTGG